MSAASQKVLIEIFEETAEDCMDEGAALDTFDRYDCMNSSIVDEKPNLNKLIEQYPSICQRKKEGSSAFVYNVEGMQQINIKINGSNSLTNLGFIEKDQVIAQNKVPSSSLFSTCKSLSSVDPSLFKSQKSFSGLGFPGGQKSFVILQQQSHSQLRTQDQTYQSTVDAQSSKMPKHSYLDCHLKSFMKKSLNKKGPTSNLSKFIPPRPKTVNHSRAGSSSIASIKEQSKEKSRIKDTLSQKSFTSPERQLSEQVSMQNLRAAKSSQPPGLRLSQIELSQRLMRHKELLQQKRQFLQEEMEQNMMKDCSFTPHFMSKPQSRLVHTVQNSPQGIEQSKMRSPQQFYDDQIQYQEKTMQKLIGKFKEQINIEQKEMGSGIRICRGSEKIIQEKQVERSQSPIYERLYNRSTSAKRPSKEPEFSFRPQILSATGLLDRENQKVDEILYNDALRRQKHMIERQKYVELSAQPNPTPVLAKSELYLTMPFQKEFCGYCEKLLNINLEEVNLFSVKIDLKQGEELMQLFGFISKSSNTDRIELLKFWDHVVHLNSNNNSNNTSTSSSHSMLVDLETFQNALLNVLNLKGTSDYSECRRVHYKFIKLFKNRQSHQESIKKSQSLKAQGDGKKSSVHLSYSARHNVLMQKGSEYQAKISKMQLQKENDISKECTFKPDLKGSLSQKKLTCASNSAKPKRAANNTQLLNRVHDEFQRRKKILISESSCSIENKENLSPSTSILQNKSISFGLSPNSVFQSPNNVEPLVYLDIHINKQRIERVAINKGQDPDIAIQRFGLKHQLTPMDIAQIKQALMSQLPNLE